MATEKGVVAATEKRIALALEQPLFQAGLGLAVEAQPGGGGLLLQRGDDVGAAHHVDLQFHPRVLTMKAGEELVEALVDDTADHQQADLAHHFVGGVLQQAADLRHLPIHLTCQGEQLLTHLGKHEARAAAGDQLASELFLETLEGLAHGGLCQVQAGRGAADGQLLADHPEGAQQVPVEAVVEQAVGHDGAR